MEGVGGGFSRSVTGENGVRRERSPDPSSRRVNLPCRESSIGARDAQQASLPLCARSGGARHGSELNLAGNRDKESR